RVDAQELVRLGALALHRHRALRVGQRQVAVRREQQVEVELLRELAVLLEARAVESDAPRRLVGGAQEGRGAPGAAGARVGAPGAAGPVEERSRTATLVTPCTFASS